MMLSLPLIFVITTIASTEYHCDDDQPCIIDCNSVSACADTSIYCPINQDCTVKCNNQYSCQNAIIYAKESRYLSIIIQAQISNAANMKIYTPSPNYMAQKSIMTCNSDQDQDQYKDEDDIGININKINHCNDISIYTTKGFDDIELKCNDDSSLCDISGSIYCSHFDDECSSFIYNDIDYNYKCQDIQFCVIPSLSPSLSPTFESVPIPSSRPTNRANNNPTIVEQKEQDNETFQVQNLKDEQDIDTLYIVIIGTLAILCVVLSVAGICGFCYIRMNRESVEETIVKRYIANRGRGASINNEIPTCNINTNGTTINGTTINGTTTNTRTNINGEDDDNFGSKESKVGSSACDGIIYGDVGSENISSFDDDDLNKILDMDLNGSPNGSEESSLGLGLTATSFPIDSDNKNNKNKSDDNIGIDFNIKEEGNIFEDELDIDINDNMTSNPLNNLDSPSNSQNGHDSFSTSTYIDGDSEDTFDFEQEEFKIEREMGLISANNQGYIKCNLPAPPPPIKKLQLYLQTDVPLTDKQKEIQLENIKNRAKCYGYQQSQILFEDDENFSDDSDDLDDDKQNLANNDSNSKYLKVITQTLKPPQRDESITMTRSRSMGQMEQKSFEKLEIKIHNDCNNNMMIPITPCSSRDPEILSDDEELPTLPTNSPNSNNLIIF